MKYEFIKDEEPDVPLEDYKIQKSGLVSEFSLSELYADNSKFEKVLKELKANRDNQLAVCTNIEIHHPSVKEIPEFDRYTIHMYQEAFAKAKAYSEKIDEVEKSFEEHKSEIEEIKNQIPELKDIVSPFVEQPSIPPTPKVVDLSDELKSNDENNNEKENSNSEEEGA